MSEKGIRAWIAAAAGVIGAIGPPHRRARRGAQTLIGDVGYILDADRQEPGPAD